MHFQRMVNRYLLKSLQQKLFLTEKKNTENISSKKNQHFDNKTLSSSHMTLSTYGAVQSSSPPFLEIFLHI